MPSTPHCRFFMLLGVSASLLFTSLPAFAQAVQFGQPYQDDDSTTSATSPQHKTTHHRSGGEHYRAQGHRPPPPGYQETPSPDFQNGPDPDHQAQVKAHRDAATGTDLRRFGSAYQDSNPTQSGQLGDATGNGWVAPRGNGF